MKLITTVFVTISLVSCVQEPEKSVSDWKVEIAETERDFAKMAAEKGISEAFLTFAADDAVLLRDDSLIAGKESIKIYFGANMPGNESVSLTWEPDFIDVATSGDLAYTYGTYKYSLTDSLGNQTSSVGIFHTVWKRQADGSWKFVWD